MNNNQNNEIKGFAGLINLASPSLKIEQNKQANEETAASLHCKAAPTQPEQQSNTNQESFSSEQKKKLFARIIDWFDAKPYRWLLIIGIAFVVFAVFPTRKNNSIQRPAVSKTIFASVPSVGTSNILNDNEICYCLEEKIRLSSWETAVNKSSTSAVNAFNRAVNDYNERCATYRYHSGALERVRSDVESRRSSLEQNGRSRAYANQ
ncbi:MAG TPA: hypothetical protein DDZ34_04755 [Syntrophaceae bacterium]|nr:hypothetical protein [Syntrophaceae bacterium]